MPISCDRVRDLAAGFVLGALDESDLDAIREHLASCPEPHPEIGELGGVVSYIGGSLIPITPPRHLKAAVLATVQAEMAAARLVEGSPIPLPVQKSVAPAAAPVELPSNVVSLTEVRWRRVRRVGTWVTRVAAVAAIVVLASYSLAVQPELGAAQKDEDHAKIIQNDQRFPGARAAVLAPEAGQAGTGTAVLLASGHLDIHLHGLPATSNDQVYMLWYSSDGGSITKSAWFTVDSSGEAFVAVDGNPPTDSLWLMICLEPNKDVVKPGMKIVTGTVWMYQPPAPTPTSV